MDKSVAELNIEHYRKLLASGSLDEAKRKTVEGLLAAEEAKLKQIAAQRKGTAKLNTGRERSANAAGLFCAGRTL